MGNARRFCANLSRLATLQLYGDVGDKPVTNNKGKLWLSQFDRSNGKSFDNGKRQRCGKCWATHVSGSIGAIWTEQYLDKLFWNNLVHMNLFVFWEMFSTALTCNFLPIFAPNKLDEPMFTVAELNGTIRKFKWNVFLFWFVFFGLWFLFLPSISRWFPWFFLSVHRFLDGFYQFVTGFHRFLMLCIDFP